jgi:hypothetical protein
MIAQIEAGLAKYLEENVEALASDQTASYLARAATSSETLDAGQGYVIVRCAGTEFVPGSLDVCLAMLEVMTLTPVNVAGYTSSRQGDIEQALVNAFGQGSKSNISAAVDEFSGFEWTGHFAEGFREGKEAQYFRPYLPVKASLVRAPVP